jgi:hypothetical protein
MKKLLFLTAAAAGAALFAKPVAEWDFEKVIPEKSVSFSADKKFRLADGKIVTGAKGEPQAVLVRGIETADGPGKLTKKLSIERRHNGADVVFADELWIEDDGLVPENINTSPRVGIDYADEKDRLRPWRFYI